MYVCTYVCMHVCMYIVCTKAVLHTGSADRAQSPLDLSSEVLNPNNQIKTPIDWLVFEALLVKMSSTNIKTE